mgnify:CR=1 FL=1
MGIYGYTYGYIFNIWVFMGIFMGMRINSLHITPEILQIITAIDEFKGTWKVLGNLAPDQLTSLRRVATIESIGSSTRIEGSKLSDKKVEELLANLQIQKFDHRDEQEVAGYAEVMNTIFENYEEIPLTENYIRQLHKELLKHSNKDYRHRGEYKKHSNQVEAFDHQGKSVGIIFVTASPFDTPSRMEHLIKWTNKELASGKIHCLLIIAVFVVEFLAIHPFQDGNGRLSRVLTTYLLLKTGYTYVPYSSLEAIVEHNKEKYYLSLRQTQGTLESDTPDWQPWITFFLKALKNQKQKLEAKLEREYLLLGQLAPLSQTILELVVSRGQITISEIVTTSAANRNTVKKHLENLVQNGQIKKHGVGKGTYYTR